MSNWPFRFLHASDFHLERAPSGLDEVPDHLRSLLLDAPYEAARRVFDVACNEEVEFVVLAGDLLDPQGTGPRGPLFLVEQFQRLADRNIAVYWVGGEVDPPDAWPNWLPLPPNVHVFPCGQPVQWVHRRNGVTVAQLSGTSGNRGPTPKGDSPRPTSGRCPAETKIGTVPCRSIDAAGFHADPSGLFSIAVVCGTTEAAALQSRGFHYWALGGAHGRSTLSSAPQVAHYPGSPQGRNPGESGAHGCTLVQVDQECRARTSMAPTDVLRWLNERVALDAATTRHDLDQRLRQHMESLIESAPDMPLLLSWTVAGAGPLLEELRSSAAAGDLLTWLRNEYGFGQPARWSLSLDVEPAAAPPAEWYEEETIRGDFLRAVRYCQMNPDEPLDLDDYLDPQQTAGPAATTVGMAPGAARDQVLRDAAFLGAELLTGEDRRP